MAENKPEGERPEEIVRFRRWIAMTNDGKWREFRGTPGIVNVGQGMDLVELVDRMMVARIAHFTSMNQGWEQMRKGLTPSNAEWIYSEMMNSLEAFLKFEMDNFSPSNTWTATKPRRAFPAYLSDRPVLDGETSPQNQNGYDHLKFICGENVSKRILKLFAEKTIHYEQPFDFEGTSEQFLALGRYENGMVIYQQPILERPMKVTKDGSCQTEEPPVEVAQPVNARRQCSGVGVSFNSRGEPTVTVMRNGEIARAPTPIQQLPRANIGNIPSLMSLNYGPPQQPQHALPPHPQSHIPQPQPPRNNLLMNNQQQLMALVITQSTTGEIVSVGYLPVNDEREHQGDWSRPFQLRAEVLNEVAPAVEERRPARGRRHRRGPPSLSRRVQLNNFLNVGAVSQQSDSGMSTTTDQARSDTSDDVEYNVWGDRLPFVRSETPTPVETDSPPVVETPSGEEPQTPVAIPQGPSYASIVSNQPTSSSRFSSIPDRNTSSMAASSSSSSSAFSSSRVVKTDNLGQENENGMTSVQTSSSSVDDEWVQVKNKAVFKPKPVEVPLVTVHPKPATVKEERPRVVSEVAENWDSVEVDEERESELERRRLKKQKQRAAKAQRQKEERRQRSTQEAETVSGHLDLTEDGQLAELAELEEPANVASIPEGNSEDVGLSIAEEATPVAEVPDKETVTVEPVSNAEPEEPKPTDYYDESGRYCDGHVIKEKDEGDLNTDVEHSKSVYEIAKEHSKLRIDDTKRAELQQRLEMTRAMKDRIDMAGRIIVYRLRSQDMTSSREENLLGITKNLIDAKRYDNGVDMEMAYALGQIVGKLTKNYTYMNYTFAILSLPEDFIPKLKEGDPRISVYKHIAVLTQLHIKRIEQLYKELCDLYEFKVVKVSNDN